MEKQKQSWKRTLSGTLALLTAIAAMPQISLSAAADETDGGLSADDKESVLREMNISTEPIDLSDTDKNPYTAGVDKIATLFPHHEMHLRDNVNDDWGGKNKVHIYDVDYGDRNPVWDSENRYETSQTASLAANSESVSIDLNGVGQKNYTASMVYYPNGVLISGATKAAGDYLEIRDDDGDLRSIMCINDEVTDDHWYWAGSIEGRNEITSGDFDGDGNDDLALLDREDGNIDILYDVSETSSWDVSYSRFRSISVESINSLINDATVRYQTQFAVGDLNGDMIDDLVVTAFNDKDCGNGNQMVPVTAIYTGTKGGNLQKAASFTHQWDLTAYNPQNATNAVRKGAYGSAAVGDVDNDGKREVVLASWKQKSASTTDTGTGIDFNQALVSIIEYDSKTKSFVAGAGGVAHTVYTNSALNSGTYNSDIQANIPLACFNPYGSGHCDLMFISGDIFSFGTGEDGYQYDNIITLSNGHPAMGFGFKKEYTPYIFPQNDKCYFGSDSAKSTNIWVGTYTVGNFENDSNGGQQLVFEHGRKKDSKTHYRHDLIEVYFDQAEGKLKDRYVCINNDTSTGRNTNLDVCAFDYGQDSLKMKFTGKKYYFSDPQVSAVFQAAPYFDELTDMDDNYQTNGETVFGKAIGSGTELGSSFSVSAGIITGFEEDISLFGFYDCGGIEVTAELSASMGGEFSSSEEKTYSSEYASTADEDRVLLSMIPYTVYEYEVYLPAFTVPSQSEYQNMEDGAIKQACESAIAKGYKYGQTFPAGWHYFSTSVPSQPRMSMITVTKYDQIADQYGFDPIRGNILNHTMGNPATYNSTSAGLRNFDGGRNVAADNNNFVYVTEGGTVTESITKSTSSSKGMTWGTGLSGEEKLTVFGFVFGCSSSYEYNGSYSWTDYSETSCSGTVAGLPIGAPDLGYYFKWQFGQWNDTLNGQDCLVLGYLTQDVKCPLPMPKDICVKDATDTSITFEFAPHMYETVIERINPRTGSVYATEVAPAKVSEYTFTTNLKADTEYTFRMFSSKPGTNERSLYTKTITGRTGYAPDANVPRVEIDDVVVQLGQDAVITAVLTPAISDEDAFYVFQKFDPENNTWKNLSRNMTLFDGTNPTLTIPSVNELDNNTKYRLYVEQDVDNDTKIIYSATATLGIGDLVDVTFQPNNGTDPIVKHIASGNNVSIPATPEKANYTFAGWFTDEACTNEFDATQPITTNITVYAKWDRTTPDSITVTWKNADGSILKMESVAADGTEPIYDGEVPAKEADAQYTYTFAGWNREVSQITGDIVYTAVFDKHINSYTVSFADAELESMTVEYGSVIDPKTPQKDGFEFEGWFTDEACSNGFDLSTPITADITLFAKWSVKVEFNGLYGDADLNGKIDILDVISIKKYISNAADLTVSGKIAADVDGNGIVDDADADLVMEYIVGMINSFPVG